MLPRRWFCTAIALVSALAPLSAKAQSKATLTGTLYDPSGAAISGAEISATSLPSAAANLSAKTVSSAEGHYTLTLPPGRYRLQVISRSFARYEQDIWLAPGETRELSFRLSLERLAESVIVTAQAEPLAAEWTAAPTQVITGEEIAGRQATSLPELLSMQTGFSAARSGRIGGLSSLFLDGGNSQFAKVLVDGTPVNEPGGAVDFSSYTLDNVAKIEVVHGAESALYGSDALAGVIQIFSQRGTTRTPRLELLAEGGNFSSARGFAMLSGALGRFDYSAAAGRLDTEGQGINNDFRSLTLSGNFGWRFSDTDTVRLTLRSNTSDGGVAGQTLLTPPNLDQHNGEHNFSSHLSWDFSTGSHWRHHLAGNESHIRQLFDNPLADFFTSPDPFGICAGQPLAPHAVPSAFCDFTFTTVNRYNRAGFDAQSSYLFRGGAVTAGYQYEVQNGSLSFLNIAHIRRNNQAGYLDARYQFGRRLTVHAGTRAEANANFGTRVVPGAGLAYALRFGQDFWGPTRLRFSYGLGIKEPRWDQSFGDDPCAPGNPNLRPERSQTLHAGVEQVLASERLRVSVDAFYNRYRDLISFGSTNGPVTCAFGAGTFFNTDLARARGINTSVEARPARWLRVAAGYAVEDSRVLRAPNAFDPSEIQGNRLIRRPVHSGNLLLGASYRRWNSNLAGYFSGHRTDSDFLGLGLTRSPGYARFDLSTSYELRHGVTAFGRVENLFDHHYEEIIGFPALGREFRLGMKLVFGGE